MTLPPAASTADLSPTGRLDLARDGARRFADAFTQCEIDRLAEALGPEAHGQPGVRLGMSSDLASLLAPATRIVSGLTGRDARPVRTILFDKSAARNWSLGWHQDRTIAVRHRIDTPGFTSWTKKRGITHVEPPFAILEHMLTVRVHLDPVGADNAPLLILTGSHRLGRVAEPDIPVVARRSDMVACTAGRGDLWVYATPILHASARAEKPGRRRVLQLMYSAEPLPNGLEWLGV